MRFLLALVLLAVSPGCSGPEISTSSLSEHEPNDGTSTTEHETAKLAEQWLGAIGTAGDVDVYFVDVAPGQRLAARLQLGTGSELQPLLTVMDAGRNGKAAGGDYVKLATGDVQWVSMGQGGYYVIVRDARNVGSSATAGSPQHTYSLIIEAATPPVVTLHGSDTGYDVLASPGAIQLYELDAGSGGGDLLFDVTRESQGGKLDARVIVYSLTEADWVARQDDRSGSSVDPLVDAPIGAGLHWLVVENVEPTATAFGFDYALTFQ